MRHRVLTDADDVDSETAAADEANAKARAWTAERLTPHVDSPLSANAGTVLIAYRG